MKIAMIAHGTRGDIEPMLALACGLKDAGFAPVVISHESFRASIVERGIPFAPLAGDPHEILRSEAARKLMAQPNHSYRQIKGFLEISLQYVEEATRQTLAASADADLIVTSLTSMFLGEAVAEKVDRPLVLTALQPFGPTSYIRAMVQPPMPKWLHWVETGGWNYLFRTISLQVLTRLKKPMNHIVRSTLGLAPRSPWTWPSYFRQLPVLYGYSQHVIPKPRDWAASQEVCGFWYLPPLPGWEPPAELMKFLESGPPPVYLGFGSMPAVDPEALARSAIEALRVTGLRAIVNPGWGGFPNDNWPENVHVIGPMPFGWLFPRMQGTVHHGGIGTLSTALLAGKPSLCVPHFADQPFWGRLVEESQWGPRAIPLHSLTTANLTKGLKDLVSRQEYRERTAMIGQRLREEDGVATAVRAFQRIAESREPYRRPWLGTTVRRAVPQVLANAER